MSLEEFPKMMVHPQHVPAIPNTIFPRGYKPKPGEVELPGSPERFPAVTVNDANQQEQYEARGYFVQGSPNLAAVEASTGLPCHYKYDEYPKWVDTHEDKVLVNSKEEEHALFGYNQPTAVAVTTTAVAVRKKPGPPKGYKRKPKSDKHVVYD